MINNNVLKYFRLNYSDILFSHYCHFFETSEEQLALRNHFFPHGAFPFKTNEIISKTDWFMTMEEPDLLYPIGLYKVNNEQSIVITFDHSGFLLYLSNSLQDLPYAMLSLRQEYLSDRSSVIKHITEYEIWCKNNDIKLDYLSHFHDSQGNILKSFECYYNYQEENYYDFFPEEKEQRF